MKASEHKMMYRYTEYKIIEMLTKFLKTLVFSVPSALLLLLRMSIEQQVQRDVSTCFQDLIVLRFSICADTNILLGWRSICIKKNP